MKLLEHVSFLQELVCLQLQLLAQTFKTQTCLLPGSSPEVHFDLTIMIVSSDDLQRRWLQMTPTIAQYRPVLIIVTCHCLCRVA